MHTHILMILVKILQFQLIFFLFSLFLFAAKNNFQSVSLLKDIRYLSGYDKPFWTVAVEYAHNEAIMYICIWRLHIYKLYAILHCA